MITIQFTQSPDLDLLTTHEVLFDRYTLSQGAAADLIINDQDFPLSPIELVIADRQLHFNAAQNPYLHNGKKNIGKKILKIGDRITVGQTTFSIVAFSQTEIKQEQHLRARYNEMNESSPDAGIIVDDIEEELLRLQLAENEVGK